MVPNYQVDLWRLLNSVSVTRELRDGRHSNIHRSPSCLVCTVQEKALVAELATNF